LLHIDAAQDLMSGFNKLTLGVILGLGTAIAVLSMASARLGPSVDSFTTLQTFDGTSVNTQIALTFTEPMDPRSVERGFKIDPAVKGDFNWAGNQLLFSPRKSLHYQTSYTLTLSKVAHDLHGKHLFRPFRKSFATQAPHLIYLGTSGAERGRLVLVSLTGKREIVGSDDGLITGFSLSFDHSLVVYAKRGGSGQHQNEIWLLSLADNSSQLLYRHSAWDMTQPHFSPEPDRRYVVFLATNVLLCQKYYGCFRDRSGPVIYLLDLRNRRVSPYSSISDVPLTNFIDFSPAGQLAYTDLGSALTLAAPDGTHVIHIPNRGNSLEYAGFDAPGDKAAFVGQTPSSSGGDILVYAGSRYLDVSRGIYDSSTPAFATSGQKIAYSAYRGELGIEPIYGINVYNFKTRRTTRLTGERRQSDWTPQWSSDDRFIAFIRSIPQEAMYMGSGEIWVIRATGTHPQPLGGIGTDVRWVG
jgi:Tol biopolymer transport system component